MQVSAQVCIDKYQYIIITVFIFCARELVAGDKEHRRKMRIQKEAAIKAAKLAKAKRNAKQAAEKAKAEEAAKAFLESVQRKEARQKAKRLAAAAKEQEDEDTEG